MMNPYEKLLSAQFGKYYYPNEIQPVNVRFNEESRDPFLQIRHKGQRTYNIDGYVNPYFNDQIPLPIRFNENIRGTKFEDPAVAHEFLHAEESARLVHDDAEDTTPDFERIYDSGTSPIKSNPNGYAAKIKEGPVVRMHGGPYYPVSTDNFDRVSMEQYLGRKAEAIKQQEAMTPYQKQLQKEQEKALNDQKPNHNEAIDPYSETGYNSRPIPFIAGAPTLEQFQDIMNPGLKPNKRVY